MIWDAPTMKLAHRVSYEIHNGAIPNGLHVLHRCDVPCCVNPSHLFVGTNAENVIDKVSKGRAASMPGELHPSHVLTEQQVLEIRAEESLSQRKLAMLYGVDVEAPAMNAKELSDVMASRMAQICEYLLPNGRKAGAEWKCGSVNGEQGQSLSVRLSGSKSGVWSDFSSGEGGDALDLWMAVRACDLKQAITEAADFLGVKDLSAKLPIKASYKPAHRPEYSKPAGRVMQWLKDRGIGEEAIKAYHVVASKDDKVTGMKADQYVMAS